MVTILKGDHVSKVYSEINDTIQLEKMKISI